MASRTWYSRQNGEPTVPIVMDIRSNATFLAEYEWHEVDASNVDVSGGEENFSNWSTKFRLVYSLIEGGVEITGATLKGELGNIVVSGDPTDGKLQINMTATQTGALETALEAASYSRRGALVARLYGLDGTGNTVDLFTAHVNVRFGTVAA